LTNILINTKAELENFRMVQATFDFPKVMASKDQLVETKVEFDRHFGAYADWYLEQVLQYKRYEHMISSGMIDALFCSELEGEAAKMLNLVSEAEYKINYRFFLSKLNKLTNLRSGHRSIINSMYLYQLWLRRNGRSKLGQPMEIHAEEMLDREMQRNFGNSFFGGKVQVDALSGHAFANMAGGEASIDDFGKDMAGLTNILAERMWNGRLNVKRASGEICPFIKGGTVVIEELTGLTRTGLESEGGTIVIKKLNTKKQTNWNQINLVRVAEPNATIFIGGVGEAALENNVGDINGAILFDRPLDSITIDSVGKIKHGSVAFYNPREDKFRYGIGNEQVKPELKYITDQVALDRFFERKDIAMIHFWPHFDALANYPKMTGRVLVIRNFENQENIGHGMKGGIIVLADKNISLEEAKKRVAPKSERPGGVVLYLRRSREKLGLVVKHEFVEM